jgi:hypothetical protein
MIGTAVATAAAVRATPGTDAAAAAAGAAYLMKLGGVRWEFLKRQGGVRQTICPLTLCQSAWIFFSVLLSQDDDYHENRPDTLQLHIKRYPNMTFNG